MAVTGMEITRSARLRLTAFNGEWENGGMGAKSSLFFSLCELLFFVFCFLGGHGASPYEFGFILVRPHEIEPGFKRSVDRSDGLRYLVVVC